MEDNQCDGLVSAIETAVKLRYDALRHAATDHEGKNHTMERSTSTPHFNDGVSIKSTSSSNPLVRSNPLPKANMQVGDLNGGTQDSDTISAAAIIALCDKVEEETISWQTEFASVFPPRLQFYRRIVVQFYALISHDTWRFVEADTSIVDPHAHDLYFRLKALNSWKRVICVGGKLCLYQITEQFANRIALHSHSAMFTLRSKKYQ